jgi:hypothetical protein
MSKRLCSLGLASLLIAGCGSSKGVYEVVSQRWVQDSVEVRIVETADSNAAKVSLPKITIYCSSCNLVDPPRVLGFDGTGTTRVYMPETLYELEPRLHLLGSGIDTTVILHARPPELDAQFFKLSTALSGRVLATQESPLYSAGSQDSVVATARTGDQLNIFGEDGHFFFVHHPLFNAPLYLLKTNAVKLF